ncbi:hypothetical protein EZV73_16535 [Acidaminobacter sp. JC074]|uniref:hypothetical protein n=1 Tax=Acidaminobacter sp. JC074 TaxID=2530199 RepID=UPI001F101C2A|nr:hypothetical protein [Acidaminobacter sp. JC074]MCH4889205.1 hypothetical protein [Acidaminobacter sp. JC074]
MHSGTKLPKKHMYIILISLSVMILSMSIETMMRVKDITLFDLWYQGQSDLSREAGYNIYVTGSLSYFFQRVIVPMALGIHTYFAYTKIRVNKLFVFMWTVLLGGGLAYNLIAFQLGSLFYYINNILFIILIVTVLSLIGVINKNKGL